MEKLTIKEIKERLDNCIDLYTDLFCKKHEVYADGWIGQIKGGINCFSDAYLSFEDIRIDLEMNVPKDKIWKWYWDNVENEGKQINYYSYVLGLRISDIKPIEFKPHKKTKVECNECVNFIKPIQKERDNLFSKTLVNAKCKLGKRVMFQKPKTNNYFDCGGYFRHCDDFKKAT